MSTRHAAAAATQLLWMLSCVCVLLLGRAQAQAEPVLVLSVAPELVPVEPLSAALQVELGVGVSTLESLRDTIPTIRVVRLGNGNVEVSLASRSLPRASRELVLKGTLEEQTETLTLIAANLVRNEAAALLPDLLPAPAPPPAPVPVVPPPPKPVLESPCVVPGRRTFGADVLPMVGTSSIPEGRAATRAFSLGLLGTYSARLKGLELSVGVNIKRLSVCGVQIAVGANVTIGPVSGVQVSEFNFARGPVVGAQFGVVSVAGAELHGGQFGVVSAAFGKVTGVQLGVLTLSGGTHGLQAGVVNVAHGHSEGFQGGITNFAHGVDGFQGGVVNLNVGALHGTQLGVANISTGEVHGVQLGVVNYADKSDASIGVLSIVRRGRTSLDASFGIDSSVTLFSVTHGGRYLHNVLGVGTRDSDKEGRLRLAFMYGIGVRVLSLGRFRVDIDALAVELKRKGAFGKSTMIPTVRVPVTVNVWRNLGLVVSPSYQVMITDDPEEKTNSIWGQNTFQEGDRRVFGYPGLALGVRWQFDHGL